MLPWMLKLADVLALGCGPVGLPPAAVEIESPLAEKSCV
jgi:hypothetical protein